KPDSALIHLNSVLDAGEGEYYEAAQYYKAKALVRKDEVQQAKDILINISGGEGKFRQQAIEMLEELK
ncbi:MAG: hypothetical protein KJ607_15160, partial [Bacteroidetes bacterium]|nr:hypothetical protein [Bacteroidota bacterium]